MERYATSQAKVWIADVTKAGTDLSQPEREQIIGAYLLIRNGTSYIMLGNSDVTWYPEYEIDLGGDEAEPPAGNEDPRHAGGGGGGGGPFPQRDGRRVLLLELSQAPPPYRLPGGVEPPRVLRGGEA